jgi:hypothetical protein
MLLTPNGRFELNTKASGAYHLILLAVHRALILKIFHRRSASASPTVREAFFLSSRSLDRDPTFIPPCGRSRRIVAACVGRADWCVPLSLDPRLILRLESVHPLAIIGLQGFFPLKGQAAMGVGALEVPSNERKRLATL